MIPSPTSATDLCLTPNGTLLWQESSSENRDKDWRERLFLLAAERRKDNMPAVRFWEEIAEQYLTGLCQLSTLNSEEKNPSGSIGLLIPFPTEEDCARWIENAPPMQGGEYLTKEAIHTVWEHLDQWCRKMVSASGGLSRFLKKRAPLWRRVGQVTFHLVENPLDKNRPFAFMATYASGLGAGNRLRHLPLTRALELYVGEKNHPALISLLSPVDTASKEVDWVEDMVRSGEIYHPLAFTAERAHRFLLAVPQLERCGLAVHLPDWWKKRMRPQVTVTIGETRTTFLGLDTLLDFRADVALGDTTLSEEELKDLLAGPNGLVLFKGHWVEVDKRKLSEALAHWEKIREQADAGQIAFCEGMRLLAGASYEEEEQKAEENGSVEWTCIRPGKNIQELFSRLRQPENIASPAGLKATLRDYQQKGVSWLSFLSQLGLGACLADDMGLGKTLQILTLLLVEKETTPPERHMPSLLVVPASLIGNWKGEAERFAPSLCLAFTHPAEADAATLKHWEKKPHELLAYDLVITTYAMLVRQPWLTELQWRHCILDEAQAIKNPGTRQSRVVRNVKSQSRIALTGTPIENNLGDLWSLFDFINPGLLGSIRAFKAFTSKLAKRDKDQFGPLRRLVAPYILRRMKTDRDVISDLPDKVEVISYCRLTVAQARLYTQIVEYTNQSLKQFEAAEADKRKRRALVLQTLMRLKHVCNHPAQANGEGDYAAEQSGKFIRLAELGEELAARQERILVFTQFREIIDPLAEHLTKIFGRPGLALHGAVEVEKRKSLVEVFQQDNGPPFFILSLKAGGTGLNLTAASQIIHFDRWWNPAVEEQATDRAFRIGQKKNVLVHKFVTQGTIEERIHQMLCEKKSMADDILSGATEIDITRLDDNQLLELMRLDAERAVM